MTEQLWLCFFACVFLHMHHVSDKCHEISEALLTVPGSICCCHNRNTGHENSHNHSIPGAAKQLADDDEFFCTSEVEFSGNTLYPVNTTDAIRKMAYLDYPIDIPIIKMHYMRC